jgi:branched-chain amino acid transport system substrate-binding protein
MGMRKHAGAVAVIAAVALVLALAGCAGKKVEQPPAKETKAPIKIGAVVSLTGTYAGLGTPEKQTIEMEVKRINDAGGVDGAPIEVIFEDDATDEAKAVSAVAKLIEQDKVVAIIGTSGSGQSMAMGGDIERAGIPQVSMAGATAITNPVRPLVFATPWSNKIVVPFTLDKLKAQGVTKIGLITDAGGFGKDGKKVVGEEAPKFGMKIVSDQTFNPGDTDMSAQLTKIKESGADVILMWTAGKEAAIIAKNREALGIKIPLVGSHGIARKEFIDGAGPAANGVKFAAGKILIPESWGKDTEQYKVATDFKSRFQAAYNAAPSTFAGHAYDALHLVVAALKANGGDTDSAKLRDAIEATKGFVGIGGVFNMSPTDHNGLAQSDLNMYEISNGEWTLAK